jgi:hypothetical protein
MFDLTRLPKIGTSDHYTILAKPKPKSQTKPVINKIKIRDTRIRTWRTFGRWIVEDWSSVLNVPSSRVKINIIIIIIIMALLVVHPRGGSSPTNYKLKKLYIYIYI